MKATVTTIPILLILLFCGCSVVDPAPYSMPIADRELAPPAGEPAMPGQAAEPQEEPEKGAPPVAGGTDDIIVTATRTARKEFDTPRAVTIETKESIERKNQPTLMDCLDESIGVWVEKRTMTTSDPVIRGFAGGNLLALVDGCTLTTLWGEGGYAGDDMYGKVDSESIERIEVIRGPSSVLYGSNALGGVLNFITRSSPIDYTTSGFEVGGRTKLSYGSAADHYMARQEFYGALPRFKFFIGGTSHKFGDTEGGRGVGTQSPTGGRDYNWDFKGEYLIQDNQELSLSIQDVKRNKVRRYYRPTQNNFNDREAMTLTWKATDLGDLFESLEVKGYFQDKFDQRDDLANRRTGETKTKTWSGDVQAVSAPGEAHRLTYGLHYQEDRGESPDDEQFTWTMWDTGVKAKDAPDSTWNDFGLYIQDEWDFAERWTAIGSVRYDVFHFNSDVDKYYTPPGAGYDPFLDDYSDNHGVFSGGLGVVYHLNKEINLVANLSRGYRLFAPKFGLTQHGYGVVAPHDFLDPIVSHTVEVGGKMRSERFSANCFTYYSSIRDWQTNVPGRYNGSDWYDFNGNTLRDANESIYVTETGRANVYGLEIETESRLDLFHDDLPDDWFFKAGFAWNYGNDYANDEPLRHTQPARLLLAIRWQDRDQERNGWFEFSADCVRQYTRIPSDRLDNDVGYFTDPQDPTSGKLREDGLPGYTVLDVRGGLDLCEDLSLTMAVENIGDKKYRRAHSRWDEPGVNFLASLTYRF